jgi:hypothetical protein
MKIFSVGMNKIKGVIPLFFVGFPVDDFVSTVIGRAGCGIPVRALCKADMASRITRGQ